MEEYETLRPLRWRGDSRQAFKAFPPEVQREMGYALFMAQTGHRHHTMAKTLKGFGGGAIIELRDNHDGNTYRAVYTIRFAEAVYVLHAFQKKSRSGARTPPADIGLVEKRLRTLQEEWSHG